MTVGESVGDRFRDRFGRTPDGVWRAPGRVNLIGEHTDYNDGFVLPFAIDRETVVAAALRDDTVVATASDGFPDAPEATVDALSPDGDRGWWSYVHGVVAGIAGVTGEARGVDLYVASSVPSGAGLSSSAALECAVGVAFDELVGARLDRLELARIARYAEETFAGVPCGIMDQVASLFGRRDHALLIDTRSLEIEPITLPAPPVTPVVIDTRVKHSLAEGTYADRRRECEAAAHALGVAALRDATLADLRTTDLDDTTRRRARHVITEDDRVVAAVAALREGDVERLGELMLESHASLRDDFDVSSDELDVAVAAAIDAGAIGARMTGGGFGGSAIALIADEDGDVEILEAAVVERFRVQGLDEPRIIRVAASDGASRLA